VDEKKEALLAKVDVMEETIHRSEETINELEEQLREQLERERLLVSYPDLHKSHGIQIESNKLRRIFVTLFVQFYSDFF